jgi:hypothetical protein
MNSENAMAEVFIVIPGRGCVVLKRAAVSPFRFAIHTFKSVMSIDHYGRRLRGERRTTSDLSVRPVAGEDASR